MHATVATLPQVARVSRKPASAAAPAQTQPAGPGRRLLAVVICICLTAPIALFEGETTKLSLASATSVIGLILMIFSGASRQRLLLCAAAVLSVASWLLICTLETGEFAVRPLLSIGNFFHPCLLFFVGWHLIRSGQEMRRTVGMLAGMQSLMALCIFPSLLGQRIIIDGPEAGERTFSGTLFGYPIFGASGYNALVVYFATAFAIVLIDLWASENRKVSRLRLLVTPLGLLVLGYMTLFSLSRQAVLGLMLFIALVAITRISTLIVTVTLIVVTFGLATYSGALGDWSDVWSNKLSRNVDAYSAGDWSTLSAGRFEIYAMQLDDLSRHPLIGNGFHGFQLYGNSRGKHDSVIGMSPHNQYLGAVWKMGLVAAVPYFLFLFHSFAAARRMMRINRNVLYKALWSICIVYLAVFCMTQDALLFPLTGTLVMFLLGGLSRVETELRRQHALNKRSKLAVRRPQREVLHAAA